MPKQQKNGKQDNTLVDVSRKETHYLVQCDDIRLISSTLTPILNKKEASKSSQIAFRVHAVVNGKKAYSYLEVLAAHNVASHPGNVVAFKLDFVLMGTFRTSQNIKPEDFGHFLKMYTVTILWPYAREYATNQFRRTGSNEVVLPIINPQVVTEHIVENNLVDVQIITKKKAEKKQSASVNN